MTEKTFRMHITDVFSLKNDFGVVVGRVEQGTVRVGDSVIIAIANEELVASVTGIEGFRKVLTKASTDEEIGLHLKGIDFENIPIGSLVKSSRSN